MKADSQAPVRHIPSHRPSSFATVLTLLATLASGGCGDIVVPMSTKEVVALMKKFGLDVPSYATDVRSFDTSGIDMALGLKFTIPKSKMDQFVKKHSPFKVNDLKPGEPEFEQISPAWWRPPPKCKMASTHPRKFKTETFRLRIEERSRTVIIYAEYWDM